VTAEKKCYNLISVERNSNDYQLLNPDKDKLEKITDGFSINSRTNNFKVKIMCEPDKKEPLFSFVDSNLEIRAADACGTIDIFGKFIGTNKYAFCSIIIFFGLILLFFGGNKWDLILGISGFIFGSGAVLFFFYVMVSFKYNTSSFAVIIVLAIVVGGLVSYLSFHSAVISYIILGFPAGYFLSNVLLVAFKFTISEVL